MPTSSVALFETNVVGPSKVIGAMTLVTGRSLTATALCISNPKACFGSCPTFYAADGSREVLQAEAFSASVAPSLEATDIDALYRAMVRGRELEMRMTNEALETHVVRRADLLLVPRPPHGRVFATRTGEFWQASEVRAPLRCSGPEGNFLEKVLDFDGVERFSGADSTNLAERETIELEFGRVPEGDRGLVIASRQTLLSTYLFYQSLAYMGQSAGQWIAALETGGDSVRHRSGGIARELGKIEVLALDPDGAWRLAGTAGETGPLAADVTLVRLPEEQAGPIRLRLSLTKGLWRLDYVALAVLSGQARPLRVAPDRVLRNGREDPAALSCLKDSTEPLVTFPGDQYTLVYILPERTQDLEVFLEARGYYLEWMREEWVKEESAARAFRMIADPAAALRELAPEFKNLESRMEESFWASRYVRP